MSEGEIKVDVVSKMPKGDWDMRPGLSKQLEGMEIKEAENLLFEIAEDQDIYTVLDIVRRVAFRMKDIGMKGDQESWKELHSKLKDLQSEFS